MIKKSEKKELHYKQIFVLHTGLPVLLERYNEI